MHTKPGNIERMYLELKQEHSKLNESYEKLYNTYLLSLSNLVIADEKYTKLLAENTRLTEEFQKEKAAYISLKGRLHA